MKYHVYIGWDPNEIRAYHVLCHSIIRHATAPVSITPIVLGTVDCWRERNPLQSTEFSFTRFLVPYLSEYQGWSLFMDVDMMVTRDIGELFRLADPRFAVQVVKHDYTPSTTRKFLDQPQTPYPRKNWSSVILFNNAKCRALTPEYVNTASGLDMHRFNWLHDSQIGDLPPTWNFLVGEYDPVSPVPANLHWTLGGPWFPEYRDADYALLWYQEEQLSHAGHGNLRHEIPPAGAGTGLPGAGYGNPALLSAAGAGRGSDAGLGLGGLQGGGIRQDSHSRR